MLNDALALIARGIGAAVVWFGRLLEAIPGSQQLIVSAFFLVCTFSILLRPLFKAGAADMVRKSKSSKKGDG